MKTKLTQLLILASSLCVIAFPVFSQEEGEILFQQMDGIGKLRNKKLPDDAATFLEQLGVQPGDGMVARTGSSTFEARTITAGSGIGVTNGNGVGGNPTVAVDSTVVRTSGYQSIADIKAFDMMRARQQRNDAQTWSEDDWYCIGFAYIGGSPAGYKVWVAAADTGLNRYSSYALDIVTRSYSSMDSVLINAMTQGAHVLKAFRIRRRADGAARYYDVQVRANSSGTGRVLVAAISTDSASSQYGWDHRWELANDIGDTMVVSTIDIPSSSYVGLIANRDMQVLGAATIGSTLGVTGNTTLGGTLSVTGAATLNGQPSYSSASNNHAMTKGMSIAAVVGDVGSVVSPVYLGSDWTTATSGSTATVTNNYINISLGNANGNNALAWIGRSALAGISGGNTLNFSTDRGWLFVGRVFYFKLGKTTRYCIGGFTSDSDLLDVGDLSVRGIAAEIVSDGADGTIKIRLLVHTASGVVVGSYGSTFTVSNSNSMRFWIIQRASTVEAYTSEIGSSTWTLRASVTGTPGGTETDQRGIGIVAVAEGDPPGSGSFISVRRIYETFGITP